MFSQNAECNVIFVTEDSTAMGIAQETYPVDETHIHITECGKQWLKTLTIGIPTFLLVDLDMPTDQWQAVLAGIRHTHSLSCVPVVAFTSNPLQPAELENWGFDGVVTK